MQKLCLYCKSYSRDFLRLERLLESIEKFNKDNLPVYISTPESEHEILQTVLNPKLTYKWISDEEIIASNPDVSISNLKKHSGYVSQGIIKSEFWRLQLAENYLCIDSDSQFLRDFYESDFINESGEPYTVIHENKELLQMARNRRKDKVLEDYYKEADAIKKIFPREGPVYSFMPSPFLWSAKVWRSLEECYLKPKGQTLWDVIDRGIGEYHWYGEALLAYKAIPILPVEPYFRVYHYNWQYYLLKRMGEDEAKVAQNFMGVIYQSNWESEMDYGAPTKSAMSRLLRSIKRLARLIESYF